MKISVHHYNYAVSNVNCVNFSLVCKRQFSQNSFNNVFSEFDNKPHKESTDILPNDGLFDICVGLMTFYI